MVKGGFIWMSFCRFYVVEEMPGIVPKLGLLIIPVPSPSAEGLEDFINRVSIQEQIDRPVQLLSIPAVVNLMFVRNFGRTELLLQQAQQHLLLRQRLAFQPAFVLTFCYKLFRQSHIDLP